MLHVQYFPFPNIERFPVPVIAEVEALISPLGKGRVKFQGSTWPAK